MAEYLRGMLIKHGHRRANGVPALQPDQAAVANTISALRQIDFTILFEEFAPQLYRAIADPAVRNSLIAYATSLVIPGRRVAELARDRVDAPDLVDSIMPAFYPIEVQDQSGKVQTDPELAALLARLTIAEPIREAVDPCCGDGVLMAAAYDYLSELSGNDQAVPGAVRGIEVDAVAARLAEIRLALKQPATIEPAPLIAVIRGDLFAHSDAISRSEVILMNPPFMRYEEQQGRRVPETLRTHYDRAIQGIDGIVAVTTGGQANLYNYYVEFVLKAARPGSRIGIILDNRWYHSKYGTSLRELLLTQSEIDGIVEYPHWAFFTDWTIATSLLVIRKVEAVNREHSVQFIRSKVDPRGSDLHSLAEAFRRGGEWPADWTCRTSTQGKLGSSASWKQYFSNDLKNDFRLDSWPTLPDLFETHHRGSLDKEGGGVSVFEFPFNRTNYGPRRLRNPAGVGWRTTKDRGLTPEENERLRTLASRIPDEFRGWALHNSDYLDSFDLTTEIVCREQTIEPPNLRREYGRFLGGRTGWTRSHEIALEFLRADPDVAAYLGEIENVVNMTEEVLPREKLWVSLREPIAGELIIPRKARSGHRVHINPFAFDLDGSRQVRTSSNFITYRNCIATNVEAGELTHQKSTRSGYRCLT